MDFVAQIKKRLDVLEPIHLEWTDESRLHIGHSGNSDGGHYQLLIVSDVFNGKSRIERQRMVVALFQEFFPDKIHALSIKALTGTEYYS